jgi:hypothetical protein
VSYVEQWRALAARIRGLARAGELYAQLKADRKDDPDGINGNLYKHCDSVLKTLKEFCRTFEAVLPLEARECLKAFLDEGGDKLIKNASSNKTRASRAGLVLLCAFESEMSYHLSNRQELLRARSERAFLHLQRLLAVDKELRVKWKAAFEAERKGELSCEKLGAVHLLWHGILAFKIDSIGARTDLVFDEPLEETQEQRGIEGLVLTEWKIAEPRNGQECFDIARKQVQAYALGPLAGSELTGYRYAVAVSLTDLPHVPDDLSVGGVIFRHINIVIEPKDPSKRARSK